MARLDSGPAIEKWGDWRRRSPPRLLLMISLSAMLYVTNLTRWVCCFEQELLGAWCWHGLFFSSFRQQEKLSHRVSKWSEGECCVLRLRFAEKLLKRSLQIWLMLLVKSRSMGNKKREENLRPFHRSWQRGRFFIYAPEHFLLSICFSEEIRMLLNDSAWGMNWTKTISG